MMIDQVGEDKARETKSRKLGGKISLKTNKP